MRTAVLSGTQSGRINVEQKHCSEPFHTAKKPELLSRISSLLQVYEPLSLRA